MDNKQNTECINNDLYFSVKGKIEGLLDKLISYYKLNEYISIKLKYRIDSNKILNSKFYERYFNSENMDGNRLYYGRDYIPESFQEWMEIYFKDYTVVSNVYDLLCKSRIISEEDMKKINLISRKYKNKENNI